MSKKVPVEDFHLSSHDENVNHLLTTSLREELKNPQGLLIEGSSEKTMKRLKELIRKDNPTRIISVGDVVSRNMIEHGMSPDVLIVDHRVMRRPIQPMKIDADQILCANNPPGTITHEAWTAVKRAIKQKGRTKVMVDGEEDLLTVVTVLSAPIDALVVYGQPHIGIVVVKVTEEAKVNMRRIIDAMEETSKN